MKNVFCDGLSYRRPKQDKDSQNEAAAAQRSEKPKHFTGQLFGSQKKEDKEQREEKAPPVLLNFAPKHCNLIVGGKDLGLDPRANLGLRW